MLQTLSPKAQKLQRMVDSGASKEMIKSAFRDVKPVAQELLPHMRKEVYRIQDSLASKERVIAIFEELNEWIVKRHHVLGKNEHTRMHKLKEAFVEQRVLNAVQEPNPKFLASMSGLFDAAQTFVIKHDWAAALASSLEKHEFEVKLPYEVCSFEFVINGKCVILLAHQKEGEFPRVIPFLEVLDGWFIGQDSDLKSEGSPFKFALDQMVAICISLDTGISEYIPVSQPAALNKKRQRAGKYPLKDYNVVDLASKYKLKSTSEEKGSHRKHRLHFRRGHWRHYPTYKKWIEWMLVGNPDLGFIDKEYRV